MPQLRARIGDGGVAHLSRPLRALQHVRASLAGDPGTGLTVHRWHIVGAAVYCELCGRSTHTWAFTDSNGFYRFTGVWNAGKFPTSLAVEKTGYVDPPGLPAVTPPNPIGAGWREVMVSGHTRFDMELVKR
jgi:hypothetical protein